MQRHITVELSSAVADAHMTAEAVCGCSLETGRHTPHIHDSLEWQATDDTIATHGLTPPPPAWPDGGWGGGVVDGSTLTTQR